MKGFVKAIALGLCVTTASYTLGYDAPAFAAEATTENAQENRMPSAIESHVYHPETTAVVPDGNAYVPKGVKLSVILAKDIDSKYLHKGDVVPL